MAWSPHKVKEIAFGDARGQLGIVTLIIDNGKFLKIGNHLFKKTSLFSKLKR